MPDDVVELQPGDQIVADGVVAASAGLALDESMLTGESDQVAKERGDAVLSGAYCAGGAGLYRVTAVGADSFAAKLTAEARAAKRRCRRCSWRSTGCCGCCWSRWCRWRSILVAALGSTTTAFREAAQTATAGLISIVPEGLVLLASVTFAAGAVRIARTGALAQQLNAIESLASVDTVCLDKTGTLTDGTLSWSRCVPAPGVPEAAARQPLARRGGGRQRPVGDVRRDRRGARRLARGDARRGAVRVALEVVGRGVRRRGAGARRARGARRRGRSRRRWRGAQGRALAGARVRAGVVAAAAAGPGVGARDPPGLHAARAGGAAREDAPGGERGGRLPARARAST